VFPALLRVHRWSSIVVTPFFLVLCLTGSILIFHDEIDRAFGWAPHAEVPTGAEALTPARLVAAARATQPELRPMAYSIDSGEPGIVGITLGAPGRSSFDGSTFIRVNAYTGGVLTAPHAARTPTDILLDLHSNWLAGSRGRLFGGLVATLVLISLLSGIAIYAPYVRDALFRTRRRDLAARAYQVELHVLVGVVVLGWAMIVAATGLAEALADVALGNWQATELRDLAAHVGEPHRVVTAQSSANVDAVIAAATQRLRGEPVNFVAWPGTALSTADAFVVFASPARGLEKNLLDVVVVDAASGNAGEVHSLPWYLKAILIAGPLHFGNYGGIALKLFWLACAWSALFVSGNGAWLWWIRWARRAELTTSPA
jgi:uncharacterized iron-regulated membrane protein